MCWGFGNIERNPEPGITFRCSQDLGPSSALSLIKVRFARRPLTAEFWFREGLRYPLETVRESRPSPPEQACWAAIRREKMVMGTVEFEKVATPEPDQQRILDYLKVRY